MSKIVAIFLLLIGFTINTLADDLRPLAGTYRNVQSCLEYKNNRCLQYAITESLTLQKISHNNYKFTLGNSYLSKSGGQPRYCFVEGRAVHDKNLLHLYEGVENLPIDGISILIDSRNIKVMLTSKEIDNYYCGSDISLDRMSFSREIKIRVVNEAVLDQSPIP